VVSEWSDFSQGPIVHVASSSVSAVSAVGETLRVGTLGMAENVRQGRYGKVRWIFGNSCFLLKMYFAMNL